MKTLVYSLMFLISLGAAPSGRGAAGEGGETSLSKAVSDFNKKSLSDPIGAGQPPITVKEVVAAILLWERPANAPVSDKLLASFKNIAESRNLPGNASFESLTGYDRGGAHVFDVWSVRIVLERKDGSSYGFVIRERVVGSRTLEEELERLNQFIEENDVKRWVGGHRLLARKRELEARIRTNAK